MLFIQSSFVFSALEHFQRRHLGQEIVIGGILGPNGGQEFHLNLPLTCALKEGKIIFDEDNALILHEHLSKSSPTSASSLLGWYSVQFKKDSLSLKDYSSIKSFLSQNGTNSYHLQILIDSDCGKFELSLLDGEEDGEEVPFTFKYGVPERLLMDNIAKSTKREELEGGRLAITLPSRKECQEIDSSAHADLSSKINLEQKEIITEAECHSALLKPLLETLTKELSKLDEQMLVAPTAATTSSN